MNIDEFIKNIKELKINYNKEQLDKLNKYYELLIEYNNYMNLTTITDKKQVYLKHFYDSLTLCRIYDFNKEIALCDIGTGAGFPGIVLKIFFPNIKILLVDSLNKRILFLKKVISKLNLEKIDAIHSRIEDYAIKNKEKFDVVTARAVAPLNILLEYSMPLIKKDGFFLALKGKEEEKNKYFNALNKLNSKIIFIDKFKLPIEDSERTIYKFARNGIIEKKYPRSIKEIKNNPL